MNKKDILELKRRFKKDACTFTRLCGCYVDADRNKVTTFGETFLNLEDEEFYKYLEIAKKVMSGSIGNNILELRFPREEEVSSGKQQFLMGLRESSLKSDELMNAFYDLLIESYHYVGNYLILVFHDAYDVMMKTSDNNKLDESEEVYEYLLCAICPVKLSKPSLGYKEDENTITSRVRDWVVGMPDAGFVFPAFSDRNTDIHSVMFYTKDAKHPHSELMENVLGCDSKMTAMEKREGFINLIKDFLGDSEEIYAGVQIALNDYCQEKSLELEKETDGIDISADVLQEILCDAGLENDSICKEFSNVFSREVPTADQLLDEKIVEKNAEVRKLVALLQDAMVDVEKCGDIQLLERIRNQISR